MTAQLQNLMLPNVVTSPWFDDHGPWPSKSHDNPILSQFWPQRTRLQLFTPGAFVKKKASE